MADKTLDDYDFDVDALIEEDQQQYDGGMDTPPEAYLSDGADGVKVPAEASASSASASAAAPGSAVVDINAAMATDVDVLLAELGAGPPPLDRPRDESDEKRMRDFVSKLVRRTKPLKVDEEDDVSARWETDVVATRASGGYAALLDRPPTDGAPCVPVTLPTTGRFFVRTFDHTDVDLATPATVTRVAAPDAHLLGEPIASIIARVRRAQAVSLESALQRGGGEAPRAPRDMVEPIAAVTAADDAGPVPMDDADEAEVTPALATTRNNSGVGSSSAPQTSLWVDKYSPQSFAELLSSETVNRNVLRWIKLWDPLVFGRPGPLGVEPAAHTGGARRDGSINFQKPGGIAGRGGSGSGGGTGAGAGASAVPAKLSTSGTAALPTIWDLFGPAWNAHAKALLLCGAPGTGKTTLAHIVARAAGYRVLEVNASDDRGKKSITGLLTNAQTSQSVFGDKRPTLVVLDEVDGMDSSAIDELVKLLKATPTPLFASRAKDSRAAAAVSGAAGDASAAAADNSDHDGEDEEGEGNGGAGAGEGAGVGAGRKRRRLAGGAKADGTGKRNGLARLTRPLILICNDQFAPSLRDIKNHVQIVAFGQTSSEKLVQRLKAIAAAEGMTIAREALNSLVTLNDCDVRSCLNTLQFLKSQVARKRAELPGGDAATRMRIRVTSAMLQSAAVGAKDMTKALFDVWSATFQTPDARARMAADLNRGSAGGGGSARALADHREKLYTTAGAFASEARMLLAGLHENLHSSRVNDPTLRGTVTSLDWLCFGEEIATRAHHSQLFSLLKYVSAAVVGVHARCASELRLRVNWPKAETAFRARKDSRVNIVRSFQLGRAAADRTAIVNALGLGAATLDVISPVVTMAMCSRLRPVSFTLANSKDRELATQVVKVRNGNWSRSRRE